MTETKILGRIEKASFGWGGYQDAMFGVSVTLASKASVWGDFKGAFPPAERDAVVTDDVSRAFATMCMFLAAVMAQAKVLSVDEMVGIPVEITLDGNTLKSWRVLEEVL